MYCINNIYLALCYNQNLIMKKSYTILLFSFLFINANAQRESFFGDAGMSLARLNPGASITYNYNLARYFGVGVGCQIYDFHATMTNFQFVPAVFWDIRFNIRARKKNHFFLFLDLGADIYKHNNNYWTSGNTTYYVRDDDGSYTGLGIGYFHTETKRGGGHYASLKLISNSYYAKGYNNVTNAESDERWGDATLVISFGFKF